MCISSFCECFRLVFHCKTPFQLGDWRLHCRQDVVKMPIKSPWPVRHVPRNKPVEWKWNVTSFHSYKIHDAGFEWTSSYLKQSWTFWFCAKPKKKEIRQKDSATSKSFNILDCSTACFDLSAYDKHGSS